MSKEEINKFTIILGDCRILVTDRPTKHKNQQGTEALNTGSI